MPDLSDQIRAQSSQPLLHETGLTNLELNWRTEGKVVLEGLRQHNYAVWGHSSLVNITSEGFGRKNCTTINRKFFS